jgi:uncharacterized OsmC-like protein
LKRPILLLLKCSSKNEKETPAEIAGVFAFTRICKEKVRTGFLYDIDSIGDIHEEVKQKVINLVSKCPVHKTLAKEIYFAKL